MTIYKTPVGDVLYALNSAASDAIVGVLGGFFSDDQIEEIMYNCVQEPVKVYHARYGMCNTNVNLSLDDAMAIVEKIARLGGKTLPFAMLDSSLPDGSRVNIVMPPVSVNGPAITIRRFRKKIMTACDFINSGTITVDACAFLWCCMDGLSYKPANILFAGGTSCGKTTLL
ncbi:MAG: ATPase, T2SS/T4P/T4SS family, partial [archaeon]|nr:ATPase, T2SS/T4P/T4SS family [archaeon]